MAETIQEKRTFKWGDSEYLLDDLLKLHAEQQQNFYNFAKVRGQYDDNALAGLRAAISSRIGAVKDGKSFDADGVLDTDVVDNISIQTQKKGLFKKEKYVAQDNTEWAKYYLNKLVGGLKPHQKEEVKDTGKWDINKHGLAAYLSGQGYDAKGFFEGYDKRNPDDPDAKRSFAGRHGELRKHLTGYKQWLAGKNFDFTKNDNEWDDDFMTTLDNLINNSDWSDSNALSASLRKLGAGDAYTTAFTSDRWDLSKTDEDLAEDAKKRKQAEADKQKQAHLDEYEDYAYSQKRESNPLYHSPFDYSSHNFDGKDANFRNWYGDLNAAEQLKYGTYLGTDNAAWDKAWRTYTNSLRSGSTYSDKNLGVLLQGTFESNPHGFIDLGDGHYLIRDSVTDSGQGTVYNPKSGYTDTVFLGDLAGSNADIKNIYRQLAYKYANAQHGTKYEDRPDVFEEGGTLVPSHQYGNKVTFNWDTTNEITEPKAKANGVSVETQKAKDQYLDSDNKSTDNPNAGWDAKHYARLGSAVADLGAAVAGFVPGYGTAASAVLGIGSTVTNFFTDMSDDAVTSGEMWKNLGLNLGMDIAGLIPGGGAASKMGKIVKTLKGTVPLIVALPGVASMLKNSPEIVESWKKAFDGDSDEGGSKMDYQDYMNILQVLNVAAGATNIARNTYKSAKKAPVKTDKIAVDVTDKKGNRRALVLEGDDVEKFNTANAEGKAQEFINQIEGMDKYTINEVTTSNAGKFWGKDQNGKFKLFNQNPLGQSSTGRAHVLNIRQETVTDFWGKPKTTTKGKPQTRLYAETGKWEADLGLNKGELVYTKKKTRLGDWQAQQQADVDAQFATWREKAAAYKTKTDQAVRLRNEVDSRISTNTQAKADVDAQIAAQQKIIDESGVEATRIQDWLDAGGVNAAQRTIRNARSKIKRLEKSKTGKTPLQKRDINAKIDELKAEINAARNEIAQNTPEAVLAAQDKVNTATTEQSTLQKETARLQALLDNLNHRRAGLHTRATTHSAEYNSINDFQPIKKKFNGVEYTFDASKPELKNLENLFKQGGSINRNKINKFLNYAKG